MYPGERQMGAVQRIFYFHVPSAMTAFLAYAFVCVASIQYLRTKQVRWDLIARVSAELGVLFSAIVLITGPLWAKPIWGVYWRWEPRLTSMLITVTMYIAYLMVRSYSTSSAEGTRRIAAVMGIIAFHQRAVCLLLGWNCGLPNNSSTRDRSSSHRKWHRPDICATASVLALFLYLLKRRFVQEKLALRIERAENAPERPGLSVRDGYRT